LKIYGIKLLSKQEGDKASIEVNIAITNKSSTSTVESLQLTASEVHEFTLESDEMMTARSNILAKSTVEIVNRFSMKQQPENFSSILIGYELQYNVADEPNIEEHFNVQVPVASFMLEDAQLDPQGFAEMLSERGHEFSHHSSATVTFPIPNDKSKEDVLTYGLETISRTTRLHVVEMVPGAASLYGKSVQGIEVAGLLKYSISGEEEHQTANMVLELKCTDDQFVEAMASLVSNLS
jgi:AP-3 complex subunit delta-1